MEQQVVGGHHQSAAAFLTAAVIWLWAPQREAPTCSEGGAAPPEGWPFRPAPDLCFDGLTATYGSHLMPVLKGLSFTIPAGTSCGIVGRTGSGERAVGSPMHDSHQNNNPMNVYNVN